MTKKELNQIIKNHALWLKGRGLLSGRDRKKGGKKMMDFIEDFFKWFAIVMTVVFILMSALFLISGQVTAGDFMSNLLP